VGNLASTILRCSWRWMERSISRLRPSASIRSISHPYWLASGVRSYPRLMVGGVDPRARLHTAIDGRPGRDVRGSGEGTSRERLAPLRARTLCPANDRGQIGRQISGPWMRVQGPRNLDSGGIRASESHPTLALGIEQDGHCHVEDWSFDRMVPHPFVALASLEGEGARTRIGPGPSQPGADSSILYR
jgi:hypothetical protein